MATLTTIVKATPKAYASFFVAAVLWCLVSIPFRGRSEWDNRSLISAGPGFLVGLGGLFMSPDTLKAIARLVLQHPVILGGITLLILYAALRGAVRPIEVAGAEDAQDPPGAIY